MSRIIIKDGSETLRSNDNENMDIIIQAPNNDTADMPENNNEILLEEENSVTQQPENNANIEDGSVTEIEAENENGLTPRPKNIEILEDVNGFVLEEKNKPGDKPLEERILFEDESKREDCVKHFRLDDGTCAAVYYGEPVHYYDETNKKYKEIDTEFKLKDDSYECDAGRFKVRFAQDSTSDNFMTITKGDLNTSWQFAGRKEWSGELSRKQAGPRVEKKEEVRRLTEKQRDGKIRFNEITDNVDIEYTASPSGVKENIIIKQKLDSYEFMFKFRLNGLKLRLSGDGRFVELYSSSIGDDGQEKDKVEFLIPEPFMFDANNERSDEVYYEIEQQDGEYILTVKADENWLNDENRAFPVTVDPNIKPFTYATGNITLYQHSVGGSTVSNSTAYIGRTSASALYRAYINVNLSTSDLGFITEKAKFLITGATTVQTKGEANLLVYELDNEYNTISPQPVDYDVAKAGKTIYEFDIESILKPTDTTFGIISTNENLSDNYYVSISRTNLKLVVYYKTAIGINGDHPYQSFDAKRAGQGFINLKTGFLTFASEDVSWSGGKMPVSIAHVYNGSSIVYNKNFTSSNANLKVPDYNTMLLGLGWKLNYQQSMLKYQPLTENVSQLYYVYSDETGNETIFSRKKDETGKEVENLYIDNRLLFYEYNSDTKVLNKNGVYYRFNTNGCLYEIADEYGNKIRIIHDADNRIVKIIDGASREFCFNYKDENNNNTEDNYLYSIELPDDPKNNQIKYVYSGSGTSKLLTEIKYLSGNSTKFTYSSNRFYKIENKENNILKHYLDIATDSSSRITGITESYNDENNTACTGEKVTYNYSVSGTNVTKLANPYDTSVNPAKEIYTYYIFDNMGRLVNNYIEHPDYDNRKVLVDGFNLNGINPYLQSPPELNFIADNLIVHQGAAFESEQNDGIPCYFKRSLAITANTTKSVSVTVTSAKTYTFSAYVKISGATMNSGAYIGVFDSTGTLITKSEALIITLFRHAEPQEFHY